MYFFFSSRRRHTRFDCDWSSDVCSSDLQADDGSWRYAWPGQIAGSPTPPQTGLAELVNELHYSLGLPVAGIYVMGIVSLLYGMRSEERRVGKECRSRWSPYH